MIESAKKEVTVLLKKVASGESTAVHDLLPLVYQELKGIAGNRLKIERSNHTLQATALVHEAYLKLIDQTETDWQNRSHFFSIAAQIMRRILVDYARQKNSEKRGKGEIHVELCENDIIVEGLNSSDMLGLDEALEKLKKINERAFKVVELKFFGGLSIEEIAESLETSLATVKRDWVFAKAWLYRQIHENPLT